MRTKVLLLAALAAALLTQPVLALVTRPSDATGERPIGDAVVVLP